jgi:hypothetical protein
VYSAYQEDELLTIDSTPIAYDSSTFKFLFTGSIEDLGLHTFNLVVLLEDLTEVGIYPF